MKIFLKCQTWVKGGKLNISNSGAGSVKAEVD